MEDIARPREGDQPALAGQEQNLPQPELLASQVAAQLHPGLPEYPDQAGLGDEDQQLEVRVPVQPDGLVGEPVLHILAEGKQFFLQFFSLRCWILSPVPEIFQHFALFCLNISYVSCVNKPTFSILRKAAVNQLM